MQSIALPMSTTTFNTSLQIGDMVYFSPKSDIVDGGFDTGLDETGSAMYELGVLVDIINNQLIVQYDETIIGCPSCTIALPVIGDFIMFQKNKQVNNSSILGYYMEATFKNFSRDKIELFSIGSEVSESSK